MEMAGDGASINARVQCAPDIPNSLTESKERKSARAIGYPLDTLVNTVGSWALLRIFEYRFALPVTRNTSAMVFTINHKIIKSFIN